MMMVRDSGDLRSAVHTGLSSFEFLLCCCLIFLCCAAAQRCGVVALWPVVEEVSGACLEH